MNSSDDTEIEIDLEKWRCENWLHVEVDMSIGIMQLVNIKRQSLSILNLI